jgi:hypothetical protein
MTTAWRRPYHLIIVLIILAGLFTACASGFKRLDDRMHRKQFKSDYESLENALAVYDRGDFTEALARFRALSTASASDKISRKAWLGAICCYLLLAETQAEYTEAIGQWHAFSSSEPENEAGRELALFDPLIVRLIPEPPDRAIDVHPPVPQETTDLPAPGSSKQLDDQLAAELAILKKKEKRMDELQRQMDRVMAENHSLKEKIKALETIDQNIQKKKTEIATPSE